MKTIDVCLSPDLMHLYDVQDRTVVVVDILRATSCMVTAFANGVDSITPYSNLEACKSMKTKGYITSGERDGKTVAQHDFGGALGELVGEKAAVVADDDVLLRARDGIAFPKFRRGLRHAVHIGEGEIFGDDRAPAVGAKFNLSHDDSIALSFNCLVCCELLGCSRPEP